MLLSSSLVKSSEDQPPSLHEKLGSATFLEQSFIAMTDLLEVTIEAMSSLFLNIFLAKRDALFEAGPWAENVKDLKQEARLADVNHASIFGGFSLIQK